jgi:hypothetical protein
MKRGKNKKNERPGKLLEGVPIPEVDGALLTTKRALEVAKKGFRPRRAAFSGVLN